MRAKFPMLGSVLGAGLLVLAFSREASAYIDPATGSLVLQFLIAGVVGAAFAIGIFWKYVKSKIASFFMLFRGKRSKGTDDGNRPQP